MGTAIDYVNRLRKQELVHIVLEQKTCVITANSVSKRAGYGHKENS